MKKLGKDILMFAEACRTRGFRRDLAFTMVVPVLVALLYFEAQSDFEVALVWWLFVAAMLWMPWYTLTNTYVPYVYGAPRRFTVSSWDDSKRFRCVRGYLEDESRRYTLVCNRRLIVKLAARSAASQNRDPSLMTCDALDWAPALQRPAPRSATRGAASGQEKLPR